MPPAKTKGHGMTELLRHAGYVARLAQGPQDLARSLALRAEVFRGGRADGDGFDARCRHLLVEDRAGALVCSLRLMALESGADIHMSYAAQSYDLERLSSYGGAMLEVGRFCLAGGGEDPDILRMAWGALTVFVDQTGVAMLFGCASFPGVEPGAFAQAFALLRARHLGPQALAPRRLGPGAVPLDQIAPASFDPRCAQAQMPPLLRSYLSLGGWVSDHAVVDADLGTVHVFTGLEIAAIPPGRARLLRALAAG